MRRTADRVASPQLIACPRRRSCLRSQGIVLLCAVALAVGPGCTTIRTFDSNDRMPTQRELKAGGPVVISLRDGSVCTLEFVAWTPAGFVGTEENGETRTIGRDRIESLQLRTTSTAKTLLLIGVVGMVAGAIAVKDTVDAIDHLGSGTQ